MRDQLLQLILEYCKVSDSVCSCCSLISGIAVWLIIKIPEFCIFAHQIGIFRPLYNCENRGFRAKASYHRCLNTICPSGHGMHSCLGSRRWRQWEQGQTRQSTGQYSKDCTEKVQCYRRVFYTEDIYHGLARIKLNCEPKGNPSIRRNHTWLDLGT